MTSPMALPNHHTPVTWKLKALAALAFICAICLLRLPFRTTIATIEILHRLPLTTPTTTDPTLARLANACARAGAWWPGRAACLETSLTLVLAAVFTGRRLHWCLGGRFDPPATHAWAQTPDGTPIGEDDTTAWPWTTALRI
ncbi:lasso peptide biosynthesis B2 protein [Nocardiopsis synnemataformans]|uniref:lasso peptide biosynthesis B2 protein n=1 Tax=Nocardiopsis synnemataformans TaxID=61305 RepID=UPI003EB70B6C